MNDVNSVNPTSLSHLVGQRNVVKQVVVALDAAQMDAKKFDHAMLLGPPGCGKTQMANIIAKEMASECHDVLGQSIENIAE